MESYILVIIVSIGAIIISFVNGYLLYRCYNDGCIKDTHTHYRIMP